MPSFSTRVFVSVLSLIGCLLTTAAARLDRRIVDTAEAGNPDSEAVDSVIASRTFSPQSTASTVLAFTVPFSLTKLPAQAGDELTEVLMSR